MSLLDWMVWTVPTGIFFGAIAAILAAMTAWQVASPSPERRGFLPIATTPGDRSASTKNPDKAVDKGAVDIDSQNPGYAHQLGAGRIDMMRSLQNLKNNDN